MMNVTVQMVVYCVILVLLAIPLGSLLMCDKEVIEV